MVWAIREVTGWWEREDDDDAIPEATGEEGQCFQNFLMDKLMDECSGLL